MDTSGHIVIHKDWMVGGATSQQQVHSVHILQKVGDGNNHS